MEYCHIQIQADWNKLELETLSHGKHSLALLYFDFIFLAVVYNYKVE